MNNQTKFCTHCGKQIPASSEFCPYCGASQNTTSHGSDADQQTQQSNQQYQQAQQPGGTTFVAMDQPYNENPTPGLVDSTKLYIHDTFTISKRMGRADYWWGYLGFCLALIVLAVVLFIFLAIIGASENATGLADAFGTIVGAIILTALGVLYVLVAIMNITAQVRRFHDIGYSGALWLLNLIPTVGWIITLILLCQPSKQNGNTYLYQNH